MLNKLILFLIVAGGATAQDSPPPQELQGSWLVTSMTVNGQLYSGDGIDVAITIIGNAYQQAVNGQVNERGTIRVDPTKRPMAIDFIISEGSAQNTIQLGIVDVSGDTMKLCLNMPGASRRPDDFKPLPDQMLVVAKRK